MLKENLRQCLPPPRDPRTGKTSTVFSCFNQDQELDSVDFGASFERPQTESFAGKNTAQWIRH